MWLQWCRLAVLMAVMILILVKAFEVKTKKGIAALVVSIALLVLSAETMDRGDVVAEVLVSVILLGLLVFLNSLEGKGPLSRGKLVCFLLAALLITEMLIGPKLRGVKELGRQRGGADAGMGRAPVREKQR